MNEQADLSTGHALPDFSSNRRRKSKNLYKGQIGQYGQNNDSGHFSHSVQRERKLNNKAIDRENSRLHENARRQMEPMLNVMHHPHDRDWILGQVDGLKFLERVDVLSEYSVQWLHAYNAEPIDFRKEGAARFAANTWLRTILQCKTDG
ncbi:hypothetical protein DJ030_12695 [bacterium endosymbiont of Escarpia laminata]|nr:MAG: hypothetical protein DJ031_12255 [bacterium endosymbiont of Escarpia laminata]RLJ18237.1 MAG: hypothetical protein DJ030_12695 [bacterium endosymbiont of Escarpia laminata]